MSATCLVKNELKTKTPFFTRTKRWKIYSFEGCHQLPRKFFAYYNGTILSAKRTNKVAGSSGTSTRTQHTLIKWLANYFEVKIVDRRDYHFVNRCLREVRNNTRSIRSSVKRFVDRSELILLCPF